MDRRRVQILFESHHSAIYGFLLRSCADPGVAEDLTQEVFLRVLGDQGKALPRTSELSWLFRIARNLLIDRWRRIKRRPLPVTLGEAEPTTAADPELNADLVRALSSLPTAEREAFLLREVGGLSYTEIGEVTDATSASVRSRIYRARCQLRLALSPEEKAYGT